MSDTPDFNETINITITPEGLTHTSNLPLPEVVFWLDTLKTMILIDLVSKRGETRIES